MTIQISKHKDNDEYKIFDSSDMQARGRAIIKGYEVTIEFKPFEKVKLPADFNKSDLIALLELHQTKYISRIEFAERISGSVEVIRNDKFALKGIDDILEGLYATSIE